MILLDLILYYILINIKRTSEPSFRYFCPQKKQLIFKVCLHIFCLCKYLFFPLNSYTEVDLIMSHILSSLIVRCLCFCGLVTRKDTDVMLWILFLTLNKRFNRYLICYKQVGILLIYFYFFTVARFNYALFLFNVIKW